MVLKAGELYFLGELDHRSGEPTPFVKIGIVRESEARDTAKRMKEHQTGNPRKIVEIAVLATPHVERIETTMHGLYAPFGVGGEWFERTGDDLAATIHRAEELVSTIRDAEVSLLTSEALGQQESVRDAVSADSAVTDVHRRLLEVRAVKNAIGKAVATVKTALNAAHGAGLQVDRIVSVQTRQVPLSFDKGTFEQQHPDLFAQFLTPKQRLAQRFTAANDKALDLAVARLSPTVAALVADIDALAPDAAAQMERAVELHSLYLELLTEDAAMSLDDELLEARLKVACGDAAGITGVCSWKREWKTDLKLDEAALKREHTDVYERFLVQRPPVTAVNVARNRGFVW